MASSNQPDSGTPKRRFGRRRPERDPNNPGRIAQMRQVFAMTRKHDPSAVWWMVLAFLVVIALGVLIGSRFDLPLYYTLILSIPMGLVAAMAVLARRAEKAAFTSIEGQPGAAGAVLGSLRRGWYYDQEPVAAESGGKMRGMRDLANAAMVYRAVGRPGVVLITEGPKGSAQRLSVAEKRKVNRVVGPDIPVHVVRIGRGEGEVPLAKLTKTMRGYDKKITKAEAIAVQQRLKALGGAKAAVPPGMDPRKARMDRRALRGR